MSDLEELLAFQIRVAGVVTPVREFRAIEGRKFRFDFAWPDQRLLCEVDGGEWIIGRHQRPAGFRKDAEKASLAAVSGWRLLKVTGSMVEDGSALKLIEAALRATYEHEEAAK